MTNPSTPGDERRASKRPPESFAGFLRRFAAHIGAFFSSPRWARFGGVSLIVAGILGFALASWFLFLTISSSTSSEVVPGGIEEMVTSIGNVLWPVRDFFVLPGLAGIYALVSGKTSSVRAMIAAGVILAAFPVVFWAQFLLRGWLFEPPETYYPPSGFLNSEMFSFLIGYGGPVGIVLVGVAALRAKGLGRFRFLPIIIGVLSAPWIGFIIFHIYSGGTIVFVEPNVWVDIAVATPTFLANLAWIAVGIVMFGAKDREARIASKEKHETEQRNLALARRLYEEAWAQKKLPVVDEIASEDFFDKRRNREGSAAFKQAISDIHYAFPDLETDIIEQTPEGDTVKTRLTFSGTDRGGVLYYPPTHESAKFTGTFTDRFEDGKLLEHDGEIDEDSLMKRLGSPLGE